MDKIGIIFIFILCQINGFAQRYEAEKSLVGFTSEAPTEFIHSENTKSTSVFVSNTGQVAFSVPINQFIFKKALMQEHFNEKFMESSKYPTANFRGTITGYSMTLEGEQAVKAIGKMTIHGTIQDVTIDGTFKKEGGKIILKSKFRVKVDDYKIKVPQLVMENIAEEIDVKVEFLYRPT